VTGKTVDQYRVGVLGLTHDHIWHHVPDLSSAEGLKAVYVADENEPLVKRFSERVDVRRSYSRAEDLLDGEQLDFVMIYSDNRRTAQLAIEAMRRKLHVIVEKPMASTLQEAEQMLSTASEFGVKLMVNWPVAWYPAFRAALRLARDGVIGRVTHVDYRAAHAGPKEFGCSTYFYEWLYDPERNGGGALMDYCSYGAMASRVLLGVPQRVYGVAGRYQKDYIVVEDNALLVMRYAQAMGTAQASWSQIGPGMGITPTIYGTSGTIIVHQRSGAREGKVVKEGQVELMTTDQPDGRLIEPPDLPVGERGAVEHFISCLRRDSPIEGIVSPSVGRDVQEITHAGYLSVANGHEVSLPLRPADPSAQGNSDE
jgi:predicted dehydrogenase